MSARERVGVETDSPRQLCVRWAQHGAHLAAWCALLQRSGALADVTLAARGGGTLRAHRVVLSAASPYLRALLAGHDAPHVLCAGVELRDLRAALDFMYRGEVRVAADHLAPLLRLAYALRLRGLTSAPQSDPNCAIKLLTPLPPPPPPLSPVAYSSAAGGGCAWAECEAGASRGPLKSWRAGGMAAALAAVLTERVSLVTAARRHRIPYPTFVLYANRVHNLLGPSAAAAAAAEGRGCGRGRGRPQRVLRGAWPESRMRAAIRAVVFRDSLAFAALTSTSTYTATAGAPTTSYDQT